MYLEIGPVLYVEIRAQSQGFPMTPPPPPQQKQTNKQRRSGIQVYTRSLHFSVKLQKLPHVTLLCTPSLARSLTWWASEIGDPLPTSLDICHSSEKNKE